MCGVCTTIEYLSDGNSTWANVGVKPDVGAGVDAGLTPSVP